MTAQNRTERPAEADSALADFVHRWAEAIVTNDVDRIATFTAENWFLVDRPGVIPREAFHRVVATGELRHERMTHRVLGIDRCGQVAIVRTHGRNSASFLGQTVEADEWTTNILIEGPDGWRCVLTQLTPREPGDRDGHDDAP